MNISKLAYLVGVIGLFLCGFAAPVLAQESVPGVRLGIGLALVEAGAYYGCQQIDLANIQPPLAGPALVVIAKDRGRELARVGAPILPGTGTDVTDDLASPIVQRGHRAGVVVKQVYVVHIDVEGEVDGQPAQLPLPTAAHGQLVGQAICPLGLCPGCWGGWRRCGRCIATQQKGQGDEQQ